MPGYTNAGKYLATARLFGSTTSAECNVWGYHEITDVPWIDQNPKYPCAVCSVINFSLLQWTADNGGGYEPVNANWSGDEVPTNVTNTPYCSVGPMGPGNYGITAIYSEDSVTHYYSTYPDDLQTLSCNGVVVTNEPKTLYISSGAQPGVTAVKFCGNCGCCPWDDWMKGPVSGQQRAGNTISGTINLPAPGHHEVSISKGKTLTLNVEGIYVHFTSSNALNLAWSQGGSHDMNNDLSGSTYSPSGFIWSGSGVSNDGVLHFGSPGSYSVHVASSNIPSCSDDKTVNLIRVAFGKDDDIKSINEGTYNAAAILSNSYYPGGLIWHLTTVEGVLVQRVILREKTVFGNKEIGREAVIGLRNRHDDEGNVGN